MIDDDVSLPVTTRLVHSVAELNQMIRSLLEDAFPPIWVEGEISNFSCPSSGHWYFTLKDSTAQVKCAMFQGKNRLLGFQPKNGNHVILRAKISLYEPRGDYQLIVDFIEEAGDGALRRAFEILKTKLNNEGLFATEHKKCLPVLPKTIGIITSPTGAAIRDILSVLKRRFPSIAIIVYPTAVQGTLAAKQIAKALAIANQRNECEILILARGGGSLEDLWCFNEEIVARAIYASTLPVISAIGHEIDFTIADFVADVRAPTPSAAAELVSPDRSEWLERLTKLSSTLVQKTRIYLNQHQQLVTGLMKRLRHPGQRIQDQFQRLDDLEQRLRRAMQHSLAMRDHKLATLIRALDAISPLATLARGYSILTLDRSGKIVHAAAQVIVGDNITAQLGTGKLSCQVTSTWGQT